MKSQMVSIACRFVMIFCLGLLITPLFGDYQFLGNVSAYQKEERGVLLICGADQLRVTVLAADLVQVRLVRNGEWEDGPSYAVIKTQWPTIEWKLAETAEELQITTAELIVKIKRAPCRLAFFDKSGNLINQDDEALGIGWDGPEVGSYKKLFDDEKFFGLGEKTGGIDKRGNEWVMWNSDIPAYTNVTDTDSKLVYEITECNYARSLKRRKI